MALFIFSRSPYPQFSPQIGPVSGHNYTRDYLHTEDSASLTRFEDKNQPMTIKIHKYVAAKDADCDEDSGTPTACTVVSSKALEGSAHKWTVQAKNGFGLGKVSATVAFTVSQPLGTATLNSPVDTISTSRPVFSWNVVTLAITYAIRSEE